MDKYIIRTPRNSPSASPTKKGRANLKQATLESLRGVVIVEELERAKIVLERSDTHRELKVDTLKHLKRKTPAKEVLVKTQIGKTVHKLCKSKDEDVAAAANEVYKLWKEHVLSKVNRPTLEVKCDLKTQNFRNSARQMLLDALKRTDGAQNSGEGDIPLTDRSENGRKKCSTKKTEEKLREEKSEADSVDTLAEYVEREVYQQTRRLVNNAYRRTIRKLVFSLRHQSDLRFEVTSSNLSVEELVKQHLKS